MRVMRRNYKDVLRLIEEIEKRPVLYQPSKHCVDPNLTKHLWDEICFELEKDWNNLNSQQKIKRVIRVQSQWDNIKISFAKELRAQKRDKLSGLENSERTKYCYFDKLLFLLPESDKRTLTQTSHTNKVNGKTNKQTTNKDHGPAKKIKCDLQTIEDPLRRNLKQNEDKGRNEEQPIKILKKTTSLSKVKCDSSNDEPPRINVNKNEDRLIEEQPIKVLKRITNISKITCDSSQNDDEEIIRINVNENEGCDEETPINISNISESLPVPEESISNRVIDEETNFVLSLVPTLKSLPEEIKLRARIEILNVLQRLKFGQPSQDCFEFSPNSSLMCSEDLTDHENDTQNNVVT